MRIAFLTPEFVTEYGSRGGLAVYIDRITRALRQIGHTPEVFTLTHGEAGVVNYDGVRVEKVRPAYRLARLLGRAARLADSLEYLAGAHALARALRRRERVQPFDFIQSSDYGLAGLFAPTRPERPHVVRCSWSADEFLARDGQARFDLRVVAYLERACLRRADKVYAPSRLLAQLQGQRLGRAVAVLRPPAEREQIALAQNVPGLPPRYLVFFGRISSRKGTDILAQALLHAWQEEPSLRMAWAGYEARAGDMARYQALWNGNAENVTWLGELPRPQLYNVVAGAIRSVLPSRIDNLPNTAIESLLLEVPIIGAQQASLEELLDNNEAWGTLVPQGDVRALAAAMVAAWRDRDNAQLPKIPWHVPDMVPGEAASRLLKFVFTDWLPC